MDFKLKTLTWVERSAVMRALDKSGYSLQRIVEYKQLPIDFVEAAFLHCIEGYDTPEKLNELSFADLQTGAAAVYKAVFLDGDIEKKS